MSSYDAQAVHAAWMEVDKERLGALRMANEEIRRLEKEVERLSERREITEFITVDQTENGRIRMSVHLLDDPNQTVFSLVRDTYYECLRDWKKFDGWMVNQ